ncbi:MAG: hypothetical protein JST22_09105 [Bacteroidetes bacterium]|nr:hypothetical protein [Bacteroidota bacterium]
MNRFIIGFVFIVLVSRFFTETLGILPKGVDLLDLAIIPFIALLAAGSRPPQGVNVELHRKLLHPTVAFFFVCLLSAAVNFERMHLGPLLLYIFGMLEGPILYLSLNKLINDKMRFGEQVARFINIMLLVEIGVVIFISYPTLILTGNPDKMSGTFGNNSYQFTALLILIGGYLIGKQMAAPRSIYYAIAVQIFIFLTFLLLQYRTATPAFFLSYAILLAFMFGRKVIRIGLAAVPLLLVVVIGFKYINRTGNMDMKYRDLVTLAEDVSVVFEYGKFQAYVNTIAMYAEFPTAIVFGSGPGTFVSRANYTFTNELQGSKTKGVGSIITAVFGDRDYESDVYVKYIQPLSSYESLFGSVQINNPNSSVLATSAETGIPGLIFMFLIYSTVVRRSLRYLRYSMATRDPLLLPLSSALSLGVIYLCLITPLDNYLEIARVTIPIWLLFWTVSTLVHQQKLQYLIRLQYESQMMQPQQELMYREFPDDDI